MRARQRSLPRISIASNSPNPTAVPVNDSLHGGQTNAGAFELGNPVQALKGSKQFVSIGHIKTGPIITHVKGMMAVITDTAKFNFGLSLLAGELPGIAQ